MMEKKSETIDDTLFDEACNRMIGLSKGLGGIGTLSEKTIHSVLKYYYAPNTNYHEIKIGSYVADICIDGEIIEIQTRNFNTMRNKLAYFLEEHDVTIVYPVTHTKWLTWLDEDTGEVSGKRKSPKKGTCYQIFPELYRIKTFLQHPNLHFIITLIDVEETRFLNGWSKDRKKGSSRMDGIPTALFDEVRIDTIADYKKLLPEHLPDIFTVKDYKKAAKVSEKTASTALNILFYVGTVERIGKSGNAFSYRIVS